MFSNIFIISCSMPGSLRDLYTELGPVKLNNMLGEKSLRRLFIEFLLRRSTLTSLIFWLGERLSNLILFIKFDVEKFLEVPKIENFLYFLN